MNTTILSKNFENLYSAYRNIAQHNFYETYLKVFVEHVLKIF